MAKKEVGKDTQSELITIMEGLIDEPDKDGITTKELCDTLNVSRFLVIKHMKELMEEGKVEPKWVQAKDIWGAKVRVKGWRIKNNDQA
jgi:predicted ArsR family transcriptional regulator